MDFEKNGHGKSWKSHGILNGRRCTNPDISTSLTTNLQVKAKATKRHFKRKVCPLCLCKSQRIEKLYLNTLIQSTEADFHEGRAKSIQKRILKLFTKLYDIYSTM
jgi:hypothetical protein